MRPSCDKLQACAKKGPLFESSHLVSAKKSVPAIACQSASMQHFRRNLATFFPRTHAAVLMCHLMTSTPAQSRHLLASAGRTGWWATAVNRASPAPLMPLAALRLTTGLCKVNKSSLFEFSLLTSAYWLRQPLQPISSKRKFLPSTWHVFLNDLVQM